MNGLYAVDEDCTIGDNCTSVNFGVGLQDGDRLMLKAGSCSAPGGALGTNHSGRSLGAVEGGTTFEFGVFELGSTPAVYLKCWCQSAECVDPAEFRAESGRVSLLCPSGFFQVGPACRLCTKGYHCPGRRLSKQACPSGQTTRGQGAAVSSECKCRAGYEKQVRNEE